MMLALLVAAQLSATDLRDLRCVYVFETASATAANREKVPALQNTAQWFRGRLSASQPNLNVFHYVSEHFVRKVSVGNADIAVCAQALAEWEAKEIGPLR